MRKKIQLAAILAFAAGIVGCILKNIEFKTALHGGVGIAEENTFVTLALGGLTFAVILISFIFAFSVSKNDTDKNAAENISIPKVPAIISAVLIAAGAVLYYLENRSYLLPGTIVFIVLALVSAFSIFYMSRGKEADDGLMKILCVVPSAFCCFWLVMIYKNYATEPQLIKFAYRCLAAAAQTMAFYYISGYFYGRCNKMRGIIASLLGIYFSVVIIGTTAGLWEVFIVSGLAFSIGGSLLGIICREKENIQ